MTREAFINEVNSFYELIDFCNNMGIEDEVYEIYSESSMNETVDEDLRQYVLEYGWREAARDIRDMPPPGYDYYIHTDNDGWFEWSVADEEDFQRYKQYVIERCDNNGYWDDEEEEYDEFFGDEDNVETPPSDPEDLIPVEEESLSLNELFGECNSEFNAIKLKYEESVESSGEGSVIPWI